MSKAPVIQTKLLAAIETIRACLREIPGHELQVNEKDFVLWKLHNRGYGGAHNVLQSKRVTDIVMYMNKHAIPVNNTKGGK